MWTRGMFRLWFPLRRAPGPVTRVFMREPVPVPPLLVSPAESHDKPSVAASREHTFEFVSFTLYRVLFSDVKGPLAGYVASSRCDDANVKGGDLAGGAVGRPAGDAANDDYLAPPCGVPTGPTGESLFPRPPPYQWPWKGFRESDSVAGFHLWINLIIVVLSFLELRRFPVCPPYAREGQPLSVAQKRMVARLIVLLGPWLGVRTSFTPDVLGRILTRVRNVVEFFRVAYPLRPGCSPDP